MKKYTETERSIIASINKQLENLSANPEIKFPNVAELYGRLLNIQESILFGQSRTEPAPHLTSLNDDISISVLSDRVFQGDSIVAIFGDNPSITKEVALEWLTNFSPDEWRTEKMQSHMTNVIEDYFKARS